MIGLLGAKGSLDELARSLRRS